MKIKVSEATTRQLDWLVAKADDEKDILYTFRQYGRMTIRQGGDHETHDSEWPYSPTTDWSLGGQIIEREGLTVVFCSGDLGEPRSYWSAAGEQQSWQYGYGPYHEADEEKSLQIYRNEAVLGPTPLIAAMRFYVISKLGSEAEIPESLIES